MIHVHGESTVLVETIGCYNEDNMWNLVGFPGACCLGASAIWCSGETHSCTEYLQ